MVEEANAQRVAREDLVLFINACFACTRQDEFYSDAGGQGVALAFLHRYLLGNYRRLYARTLAAGVNHFNRAEIVFHLLATGRDTPPGFRAEENALVRAALRELPPQRVLRLFRRLRRERVNNRRTRAVIRDFLAGRPDSAFDAVKYRSGVRAAAAHAHLSLPGELGPFLFEWRSRKSFATELFEKFRAAHYSAQAVYALPYTIAEGLAQKHGIAREDFLRGIAPRLTEGERLRLQRAAARDKGVDLPIDLGRVGLTRLALYILSLPLAEREARRGTLEEALRNAARRALARAPTRWGRVAAVLDRSYSSSGSAEKRRRPLAVALASSVLLREASTAFRAFWTPPCADALLVAPRGQTDLAGPLLDALEWGAELVVIVSDGFENDPPATAARLVGLYREKLDGRASVIHVNPVFDAEHFEPRTLGPAIPTVGVRDAEDLPTMLRFARYVEGRGSLTALEDYLGQRVRDLLARQEGP